MLIVSLLGIIYLINPHAYKPITVFRGGSKIGSLDLTGEKLDVGYNILTYQLKKPIYLNLETSSQAVTLNDIGIGINLDALTKMTKTCRFSLLQFFCKNTSNEALNPLNALSLNQEKLDEFLNQIEHETQFLAENTIISFSDYTFRAATPNAAIELDREPFSSKEKISQLITQEGRVKVKLNASPVDNKEEQQTLTKTLISNIQKPLLIKYGRNPVYIPAETIATFITTEERDGLLYGKVIEAPIGTYLDKLGKEYESEDVILEKSNAVDAIRRALLFRATDYEINNAVILPIAGKPQTDGSLHNVYLEVVKDQQRLYRWENGELVKTYIISTGLTWETPPGEYKVLGKQKMTISYYDDWYMPNYLPIGTINGYRFGFHSIPYHQDAAGNIYSRDPNTMGSPATGGCIQLTEEESLELFNWAEIGTPVYIYE